MDGFAGHVRFEDPRQTPEHTEYHFLVDGGEFPWFISERGAVIKRLADDMYTVGVEIFLIDKNEHEGVFRHPYLPFGYTADGGVSVPNIPVIDGTEFPWLMTEDGWQLSCGHKTLPTLKLTFFAHHVSGDCEIDDQRKALSGEDIFCNGGHLIGAGG